MSDPLLSICIPTHHGRREVLTALLEDAVAQAAEVPDLVELCVSDNASSDGTAEMVSGLRDRAACDLAYRRQPRDIGMAPNLLAAVEMARGSYCWLMGSDDLLVAGALSRTCELLAATPGATGYVVGSIFVDARDPTLRSRQLPRAFHPPGAGPRTIAGFDAVLDSCANAWTSISWNLVARDAWLRAVREQSALLRAHPVWPQLILLAAMARARPRWVWLGERLVRQRNADPWVFEQGRVPLADRWSELVGGQAAAWGAVLGRGSAAWRRRMRGLHAVWGTADDARATKLYDDPSLRSQARLATTWLRAFWPVWSYWREVLPATLAPTWFTRARSGSQATAARGRGVLMPGRDQLVLSAALPARLAPGDVTSVNVTLRNAGEVTVASTGPRAVGLEQRWWTADGREVSWDALRTNELARLPVSLPQSVRPHRTRRAEIPLYAPHEPGRYRVDIVAQQHGLGWLHTAGVATAVSGSLTVAG